LLAAGTAPAVDYGIRERQDGRFEIKWKTTPVPTGGEPASTGESGSPASPTTDAIETEIAQAAAQGDPARAAAEDPELAAVETSRLIAELERRGYRAVQAVRARQRKAAELDAAAARGVMPTKPVVIASQVLRFDFGIVQDLCH
jgi:hypothetical protein